MRDDKQVVIMSSSPKLIYKLSLALKHCQLLMVSKWCVIRAYAKRLVVSLRRVFLDIRASGTSAFVNL
jgi:hypothetical protein